MPIFPTSSGITLPEEISATQNGGSAFVQVSIELMMREDISPAALKLYMFLLYYCGPKSNAWPSQSRLAERMHLTERRIRTLLQELVEAGLVFISHNTGTSNTYHLRKFQLKSSGKNSPISTEQNNRGERKDNSAHVHDLEYKTMCESVSPDATQTLKGNTETFEEIQQLFQSSGMSLILSKELTTKVIANKRDITYVKLIINASQHKKVGNPYGYIRFMVMRDSSPVTKGSSQFPRKKTEVFNQPLDFSKYTSGKYAYLTGSNAFSNSLPEDVCESGKAITSEENPFIALLEPGITAPELKGDTSANNLRVVWLQALIILKLSGFIPETFLEHARVSVGDDSFSVKITFPGWITLSQSHRKYISEAVLQVLGKPYKVII